MVELVLASSVVGIVVGVLALVVRFVPYPEDLEPRSPSRRPARRPNADLSGDRDRGAR